jgi:hypothetical protein
MAPHILQFFPAPPLSKNLLERTDGVESLVRCAKVVAIKARGDVLLGGPSTGTHHVPLPFTAKIIQRRRCGSLDPIRLGLGQDHRSGKLCSLFSRALVRLQVLASCAMTKVIR